MGILAYGWILGWMGATGSWYLYHQICRYAARRANPHPLLAGLLQRRRTLAARELTQLFPLFDGHSIALSVSYLPHPPDQPKEPVE